MSDRPYFSFHRVYLVVESADAPPIGIVRKDGRHWRMMRFGVPDDHQPREGFVTRQEAAERLQELNRQ